MIVLHQSPPAARGLSLSPFCIKVEAYLRLCGLPYRTAGGDPRKAPKGKIPWLTDGGRTIADSSDIVAYLKARYGDPLDGGLTPPQRAQSTLLQRTVEEHLYWVLVHLRWAVPGGYAFVRASLMPYLPPLVGGLALDHGIRRSIVSKLRAQGLGVHDEAAVYRRAEEDLSALATCLGDQAYFLGDDPRSVDASIFGFLLAIAVTPGEHGPGVALRGHPKLVEYIERMYDRCFAAEPPGQSAGSGA